MYPTYYNKFNYLKPLVEIRSVLLLQFLDTGIVVEKHDLSSVLLILNVGRIITFADTTPASQFFDDLNNSVVSNILFYEFVA